MISSNDSGAYRHSLKPSRSLVLAGTAVRLLSAVNPLRADEVSKWNEVATKASLDSGLCGPAGIPLFESRVYALTFAAVHDALNRVDRRYSTYVATSQLAPGASPAAAVATAAHDVLVDQFNRLSALPFGFAAEQGFLDNAYTASMAQFPTAPRSRWELPLGTRPLPRC